MIKGHHELKKNTRARSKVKTLDQMTDALEAKGIDVNKDSLAQRVKNPKRIADLEKAKDKRAKEELGISDDSDDESDVDSDKEMKDKEAKSRGRTREKERSKSVKKKTLLGKRRAADADIDMEDDGDDVDLKVRGSLSKQNRNMTPSQRKVSVQKLIRDRTASRREGNEPQRLDYKIVPEEQVRLAKKINATWKHKIQRSEADREVNIKRPKHLFAGKMSNGKKDYR